MGSFSSQSEYILSMGHKDFQILFHCVVLDFDCTVVKSYESKEETDKFYQEGLSKIPYPTGHNTKPSVYIDVAPYVNGQASWEPRQALVFSFYVKGVADQLFRIGSMKHHIRCGSDWNGDNIPNDPNAFNDPCHFEVILSDEEKAQLQYYEI
jgi:hypothetical protein